MHYRICSSELHALEVRVDPVAGVLEVTVRVAGYTIHKQSAPECDDKFALGQHVLHDWERILRPITGESQCYPSA